MGFSRAPHPARPQLGIGKIFPGIWALLLAPVFKNKDDKTGTKKETKFLRCMSNCKSECQKPRDGLASLDCNQDCQDQCCESYEQCSFKVRTRSSEM